MSRLKSNIDKDYKSKGHKSLSSFKKVEINKRVIDLYKSKLSLLKDFDLDTEFGYLFLDGDNIVGFVACNDWGWITDIQVTNDYKGYGIGDQLLNYAMVNMGGNRLGVHSDNEVAYNLYKKKGFREVDAKSIGGSGEKGMIFMTTDKNAKENTEIVKQIAAALKEATEEISKTYKFEPEENPNRNMTFEEVCEKYPEMIEYTLEAYKNGGEYYNEEIDRVLEASILYKAAEFGATRPAATAVNTINQNKLISSIVDNKELSTEKKIEKLNDLKPKFKRVQAWRMNHGNLVPIVDKAIKEKITDQSLKRLDKEIEKLKGTVKESTTYLYESINPKSLNEIIM